jgi:hypothetical protein
MPEMAKVKQVKKHEDHQKRLNTFVADIKQRRDDYLNKMAAGLDAREKFISEFLQGRISLRELERKLRQRENRE